MLREFIAWLSRFFDNEEERERRILQEMQLAAMKFTEELKERRRAGQED